MFFCCYGNVGVVVNEHFALGNLQSLFSGTCVDQSCLSVGFRLEGETQEAVEVLSVVDICVIVVVVGADSHFLCVCVPGDTPEGGVYLGQTQTFFFGGGPGSIYMSDEKQAEDTSSAITSAPPRPCSPQQLQRQLCQVRVEMPCDGNVRKNEMLRNTFVCWLLFPRGQ